MNHPATPGEYVTIYLVGMGATMRSIASGAAAPSSEPLARLVSPATVTLGGAPVTIGYAGLTPGAVGLYQITFLVPRFPVPAMCRWPYSKVEFQRIRRS